jgi:parallel beta-helix repeat protein
MVGRIIAIAVLLFVSSRASAETYVVSPDGDDGHDGVSSPWLTIQHAINALPPGDHTIELSPGTYVEQGSLDLSKVRVGNLTLKSKDPANPAVITSSDDKQVVYLAGDGGIKSLSFSGVSLVPSKATHLAHIDVQAVKLAFDHCSLTANSALVETTERASEVTIDFSSCRIKSEAQGLIVKSAKAVSLKGCALAWNDGAFVQGAARSIVFDGCTVEGPAEAQFFSFSRDRSDKRIATAAANRGDTLVDLLQVSDCEGTCGVLLWEHGGIRQLLITGNKIQWKYTGRVIGAGPEISWNQKAPLVDPAPFEKIVIAHNNFQFPDGTSHAIFLSKGADNSQVVDNVLIMNNARQYGIVVKSDHNLFESNIVYGGDYAFILAGSSRNTLRHNTIYASKGVALAICPNQEEVVPPEGTYGQSRDNVLEDNILISADGLALSQEEWRTHHSHTWNTRCDRNVYWNMAGGDVIRLPHASVLQEGGIAAVRAQWAKTYPGGGPAEDNDKNSVVADPLLSAPPTDFSLRPGSPALLMDQASNMNAGAWQKADKPKP